MNRKIADCRAMLMSLEEEKIHSRFIVRIEKKKMMIRNVYR